MICIQIATEWFSLSANNLFLIYFFPRIILIEFKYSHLKERKLPMGNSIQNPKLINLKKLPNFYDGEILIKKNMFHLKCGRYWI